MSKPNKCLKCNQFFKSGEEYLEVSNNPKAGTYHESCWKEVEAEQSNNYPTCQECKRTIKAGEERASETMPDAFSPHTVYYHKSCWEKKEKERNDNSINTITKCSDCGHFKRPGACGYCMITGNRRGTNKSSNSDDNDNPERERERAKSAISI